MTSVIGRQLGRNHPPVQLLSLPPKFHLIRRHCRENLLLLPRQPRTKLWIPFALAQSRKFWYICLNFTWGNQLAFAGFNRAKLAHWHIAQTRSLAYVFLESLNNQPTPLVKYCLAANRFPDHPFVMCGTAEQMPRACWVWNKPLESLGLGIYVYIY